MKGRELTPERLYALAQGWERVRTLAETRHAPGEHLEQIRQHQERIAGLGKARPGRAVAFEQMTEREALKEHPDLAEAYKTMHAAAAYFALTMPGKPEAQEASIQLVKNRVQNRLDAGETTHFSRGREQENLERQPSRQRPEPGPGPERER